MHTAAATLSSSPSNVEIAAHVKRVLDLRFEPVSSSRRPKVARSLSGGTFLRFPTQRRDVAAKRQENAPHSRSRLGQQHGKISQTAHQQDLDALFHRRGTSRSDRRPLTQNLWLYGVPPKLKNGHGQISDSAIIASIRCIHDQKKTGKPPVSRYPRPHIGANHIVPSRSRANAGRSHCAGGQDNEMPRRRTSLSREPQPTVSPTLAAWKPDERPIRPVESLERP